MEEFLLKVQSMLDASAFLASVQSILSSSPVFVVGAVLLVLGIVKKLLKLILIGIIVFVVWLVFKSLGISLAGL